MASDVDICSAALLLLGGSTISSFDESTERARLCKNLFPIIRARVLRDHPWNCCIKRVELAADSSGPLYDYTNQFTLPSDWLRTLSVGEYGFESDFKSEGRKILCDDATLKLRYIYLNKNPETYDAMLTEGLVLAMAAALAYPVTASASMKDAQDREFTVFMKRARAVDGQDDPPETLGDFPLLAARFGSVAR